MGFFVLAKLAYATDILTLLQEQAHSESDVILSAQFYFGFIYDYLSFYQVACHNILSKNDTSQIKFFFKCCPLPWGNIDT